eukprot:scaffold39661_cov63-Cyclotella_meneghiniana.AAC.6
MAGLSLKNALVSPPPPTSAAPAPDHGYNTAFIPKRMTLTNDASAEIKSSLLQSITDEVCGVRSAASTAIARCCTMAGSVNELHMFRISEWSELIPFLLSCINQSANTQQNVTSGALLTLRKLLEDIPLRLAREAPSSSFNDLTPALLALLSSQDEIVRKESLACLNCLIDPMPGSLVARMNDYLTGLSGLAADPSTSVRKLVCQGIVALLSRRSEYIRPHIASISEFMLKATSDPDPLVAIEACDFWLTFASLDETTDDMMECIAGLLPRLLPQLLKGMVYPAEKIEELMEANALDEDGGMDKAQDLAPVFHKSGVRGTKDDDSESEEDNDFDDDNEWTLRKCSAASLDALAGLYGAAYTLPPLLPALEVGLSHNDQWIREASILALGAIAEGCQEELAPHLPQLHPFLLSQLSNSNVLPQLRCIAAWTIGRYSSWVVDQMNDDNGDKTLVAKVAQALAGQLLDRNKKVQVAICSAFGVFVEATCELMVPYLEPVYQAFVEAMKVYRTRSLMILLDTMGVMANYVGTSTGEGPLPGLYVPALLQIWNDFASDNPFDRALLPLMECLASITVTCGLNFQPWAMEAFENSMSMIEACNLVIAHEEELAEDDELADPIICSVDLLDGLVEALGGNFVALVSGSSRYGPTFANVLVGLSEHQITGVRMSFFALLGDLARKAPSLIEAGLPKLLSEALSSIDPMHSAMCNNAIWAIGEVCVRCGVNAEPLNPHAAQLVQLLIPFLMGNSIDIDGVIVETNGIAENAATTMGRLACVDANFVAPEMSRFLHGWLTAMSHVSSSDERRDAFQGFVLSIRANPQSIQSAGADLSDTITAILFAVMSWHIPQGDLSPDLLHSSYGFQPFPAEYGELLNTLKHLLRDIKASAGECWATVDNQMPTNVKRLMAEVYGV